MTERKPLRFPSTRLVAIAVLAGLLSGAAAVYFRHIGSDGAVQGASAEAAGACEGAASRIAAVSALAKGQVAAMTPAVTPRLIDLAFKGPAGQEMTLADLAGRVRLVNLWATWCVPCREEMPALNALETAEGGDGFEVVTINIDTGGDEKPKAFFHEYGIDRLKLYRDSSLGVFNSLKKEGLAFGLPATLLIDAKGCLLASMNGPAAWDSPDARALIAAAR